MNNRKRSHKKASRFICSAKVNALLDKPFTAFDPDFKPEYWWENEEYEEYNERLKALEYCGTFIHLNVHTKYSIGYGAADIKELIHAAKHNGMKAMAITDFATMKGVYEFCEEANKAGIKPIVGCEFFVVSKEPCPSVYFENMTKVRLTLLAMDGEAYRDILCLILASDIKYGYDKPYIAISDLRRLFENKDVSSLVGIGSYMTDNLSDENINTYLESADELLKECAWAIGDGFFVGIKKLGLPWEDLIEERTMDFNPWGHYMVPTVAVNDVRFSHRDEYRLSETARCVSENMLQCERKSLKTSQYQYMKSAEDMDALFSENQIAITNTWAITSQCDSFDWGQLFNEFEIKPMLITFNHNLSYWETKLRMELSDDGQEMIDALINYAQRHFQCKHSAKIIAYGKCTTIAAIKHSGEILGIADDVLDSIRGLLPDKLDATVENALKQSSELYSMYQRSPVVKTLIDSARIIQKLPLDFTTHQSAFVISSKPMTQFLPVRFYDGAPMIEWPLSVLEKLDIPRIKLEDL